MQVEKLAVQRPLRERGEVVGGGEVVARLKWLNGPGVFMQKYVHKNPLQDSFEYQLCLFLTVQSMRSFFY